MQMNGARNVAAGLDATWTALNDSAVLKECIPGCELIEATAPNEYRVTMTSRIGRVAPGSPAVGPGRRRASRVVQARLRRPGRCRRIRERFGARGTRRGRGHDARGLCGHGADRRRLARIGSRLIDAAATKVSNDFFARFAERLAPRGEVSELPASPAASPATTNPAAVDSPGSRRAAWGLIAIGVVACLFVYIAWKLYSATSDP